MFEWFRKPVVQVEISAAAFDEIVAATGAPSDPELLVERVRFIRGAEPAVPSHPAHRPIAPNAKTQRRERKR